MAKKFRVKWQRYFELYDVKDSFTDSSPGLIYNQYTFHTLLNFKVFKKHSKKSLFKPYSRFQDNIHHHIKYKYVESKYNYDLVLEKIYKEYYNFDHVLTQMLIKKIQYVPLVDLFFEMRVWYRVDCYLSLCKNWNEFISDSFLEYYNTYHVKFDHTLGTSYQAYFDIHIREIFSKNYIINRDKDDADIKTIMHRLSWLHPDELSYDDNISLYSYYLKSKDLYETYIKDKEEEMSYQLDPHLTSSQDFLDKF